MANYMHKETGSINTKENWVASYDPEELEERGLSAEEAFKADEGKTLFKLAGENPAVTLGRKGGQVKSEKKRLAAIKNGSVPKKKKNM